MENLDPLGIHTGESIVVAPSQTLTNRLVHSFIAQLISKTSISSKKISFLNELTNMLHTLTPFSIMI